MKKVLKKGVAGVLLGVTLLGTTAFAGVGSFNFRVAPGEGERGTGVWINKSRSQSYADINVKSFSGVGAYIYVKNDSYNRITGMLDVRGVARHYPSYGSSAPMNNNYQLFASPIHTNPYRITIVKGDWQP